MIERARRSGRFAGIAGAMLAAVALALGGCGEAKRAAGSAQGILTVVRVEVQKADGSWAPVADAKVHYEVYGTTTVAANVPMYYEFDDVTDGEGISAVWRDVEGKTDSDIGQVFVEVELTDGRTSFKRPKTEVKFDFLQWLETFLPAPVNKDVAVRTVCETVIDFPDCESALKAAGLKSWGVAQLVRISS